ncbi:catechol 1,2-dioxygenase [Amycolatopsis acidiphila]|uniref:Catechol 1,2-dioxygenase n=1 Tax=Amycolatopsis acidiphila TaxID=715473 RepID=A0A558ADQ9_9PSEU|nr:catechol 1,2-dioxygenase [Amycolatopsis acidiphila]TVT22407.1 catechol 1,2-dioxygenase [Amycolatopsis acidiphila]UIJ57607.1 catechol 1,2-dioxygenase [Amycolatopsis acidiphila]GHG89778.1 catechol 1,2-dioxygenase [Amycolatopsis acidiphila]
MTDVVSPTAATSGASATERFQERAKAAATTGAARVNAIASDALAALHEVVRKHQVTYDEYNAFKAWLIRVGEDGEWPLFLDVFLEHEVEKVANATRQGTVGSIEGPYYVEGAPELGSEGTLPMRDGEAGRPLRFFGQVRAVTGEPLAGSVVDFWQADDDGLYSQFAPGIPEWNLRGRATTDAEGNFSITTIHPAPYQIPTDGATGALIAAAGWHAWRPAHLHIKVSSPGYQLITTQLYFDGGEHVADDIATAVKDDLILAPTPTDDGSGEQVRYDFVLDPA